MTAGVGRPKQACTSNGTGEGAVSHFSRSDRDSDQARRGVRAAPAIDPSVLLPLRAHVERARSAYPRGRLKRFLRNRRHDYAPLVSGTLLSGCLLGGWVFFVSRRGSRCTGNCPTAVTACVTEMCRPVWLEC